MHAPHSVATAPQEEDRRYGYPAPRDRADSYHCTLLNAPLRIGGPLLAGGFDRVHSQVGKSFSAIGTSWDIAMPEKVRVGMVGTSWWTDMMYLPSFKSHPAAEIVAICGRNHNRA